MKTWTWVLLLATWVALSAVACGGGGGKTPQADQSETETSEVDQLPDIDPCEGVADSCTAVGTRCDENVLVTCSPNSRGCLVETRSDCTFGSQICQVQDEVASCVTVDPCEGISNCGVEARSCDGDTLVVCVADLQGCLVETRTDCTIEFETCDPEADPVACATGQIDPCEGKTLCTELGRSCDSDTLVVCAADEAGCLVETRTDCTLGEQICSSTADPVACVTPCTDAPACEGKNPGDAVCNGDVIEACLDENSDGCLELVSTNCAPGLCELEAGTPVCVTPGTGNSCAEAIFVLNSGFRLSGDDFFADFTDTLAMDGTDCRSAGLSRPEVIFEVPLASGDELVVNELGVLDSFRMIIGECSPTQACMAKLDDPESSPMTYTATTDETVFIVVESFAASSTAAEYDIAIDINPACGNGFVELGETCDDQNDTADDGCTACVPDLGYSCSGTPSICTPLEHLGDFGYDAVIEKAVDSATNVELWYTITFTEDVTLSGTLAANNGGDADFRLLADWDTEHFADENLGDESWTDVSVPAGDYLVGIIVRSPLPEGFTLQMQTGSGPFCGDGIVTASIGEECDDNNANNADGCSDACLVEPGYVCTGQPSECELSVEGELCGAPIVVTANGDYPGSFGNYTNDYNLPGSSSCTGYSSAGPDVAYQVELAAGDVIDASLATTADGVIYIVTDCDDLSTCLVGEDNGGTESVSYTSPVDQTVFVIADTYSSSTANYTLTINVRIPACGDGIVDDNEDCDDNNVLDSDGCSALCEIEAGFSCFGSPSVCITGSLQSCASPGVLSGSSLQVAGSNFGADFTDDLSLTGTGCNGRPAGAKEAIFQIDLLAGQSVTVSEHGSLDSVIHLLESSCDANTICAGSSDGAEALGLTYAATSDITIFAIVESYATTTSSAYDIRIAVITPSCGDGVIEGAETCDDGELLDGDGCSAACAVEAGYRCAGEPSVCTPVPPGDNCALPVDATGGGSFTGSFDDFVNDYSLLGTGCTGWTSAGPDAVYVVDVMAGEILTATLTGAGVDTSLYILTDCGVLSSCVAGKDSAGTVAETVSYASPIDQTLYVIADTYSSTASGTYELELEVRTPTCGDGIVEGSESCDDGELLDGDGCSSVCEVEPGYRCLGAPSTCTLIPQGDTCAFPLSISGPGSYPGSYNGFYNDYQLASTGCTSRSSAGADIAYEVSLLAGEILDVSIQGTVDTAAYVLTDCSDLLSCVAGRDVSGTSSADSFSYSSPVDQTVYLIVDANSATTGDYTLSIDIRVALCGDGLVESAESCDDGNDLDSDGCSSLCEIEPGYSCFGAPSTCMPGSMQPCGPTMRLVNDSLQLTGSNFSAAFENNFTLNGSGCNGRTGSDEIVIEIELLAGQVVTISEHTTFDAIISLLEGSCDTSTACYAAIDFSEDVGVTYTAATDTTVFAVFESYSSGSTSAYDIRVLRRTPGCGDGFVEGTEVCDDGNDADGDGCSSLCEVEPGYLCFGTAPSACVTTSTQPCGATMLMTGDSLQLTGSNWSADFTQEVDLTGTGCTSTPNAPEAKFQIDMLAGQVLKVSENGSLDSVISLLTGTCDTATACELSSNSAESTGITYTAPTDVTVFAVVESFSATSTSAYDIRLSLRTPSCGDGIVEGLEECDDGELLDGDGCTASCTYEPGFVCFGSPSTCVPGSTQACGSTIVVTTDALQLTGDNWSAAFSDEFLLEASCTERTGSAEAKFEIPLLAGQILKISEHGSLDSVISLLEGTCDDTTACLVSSDSAETTGVTYTATADITIFAIVEAWSSTSTSPFDIRISVRTPGCGDGIVEGAEECDDGELLDGDGCSASCELESGFACFGSPSACLPGSTQPCGTAFLMTTDSLQLTGDNWSTSFTDEFLLEASCTERTGSREAKFEIPMSAGQILEVSEHGALDSVISLLVGSCDDTTACEVSSDSAETTGVSYTATADVTVFAIVEAWSSTSTSAFDIRLSLRTPGCGDGVVEGTETCDDGELLDGDGCSATCEVEAGYRCTGEPSVCTLPPPGDTCDSAIMVSGSETINGTFDGFFNDYTFSSGTSSCTGYTANGPDIAYQVDLLSGQVLDVELDGATADTSLYILTDCSDTSSCLVGDDSTSGAEFVSYTATADQTVYVIADAYITAATGAYELVITITTP
ncbi:MAG: DUF4215 domain-containing protein [Myxococcota bacterium]|jgi:cysteine-rich repeat protein|nr:DUF4215 domain-containing protein [Myxococcota bacterium]